MPVNINELAEQWKGRRLAELILRHYKKQSLTQCYAAMQGLLEENREELKNPTADFIDFLNANPDAKNFFSDDLSNKFLQLADVTKGFFDKGYGILISEEEYFNIFNILIINWAVSCHQHPQTKAAMQKGAGLGFVRRLFG